MYIFIHTHTYTHRYTPALKTCCAVFVFRLGRQEAFMSDAKRKWIFIIVIIIIIVKIVVIMIIIVMIIVMIVMIVMIVIIIVVIVIVIVVDTLLWYSSKGGAVGGGCSGWG